MRKKGILGGTFNPVHVGHLHLAQVALDALGLDELLFVPSYSPPHKLDHNLCSFEHRIAMLRLAVASHLKCSVSDVEGQREGFSYTIDTLQQLSAELDSDVELVFMIGFDAFQEMGTWKNYLQLLEYATIAVCERNGSDIDRVAQCLFGDDSALILEFTVPEKKVSSSSVRELLKNDHQGAAVFLPPDVLSYIEKHGLYL